MVRRQFNFSATTEIIFIDLFLDAFIKPSQLFNALMRGINLLIVDIRPPTEFQQCHIFIHGAKLINIPSSVIVSG